MALIATIAHGAPLNSQWARDVTARMNARDAGTYVDAATRDLEVPLASRIEGQFAWLTSTNTLTMWDGAGWIIMWEPVKVTATASFNNFVGGTPTYANRSRRSGGRCWFENKVTFGSAVTTMASPGAFRTILPYAATAFPDNMLRTNLLDAGVNHYPGWVSGPEGPGFTTCLVAAVATSGAAASLLYPSNGVPFAWTVNDQVMVAGDYELANLYSA